MAGTIKGMTIEIGGDTAPLEQALKNVNKDINSTQKELREVEKLLKLDPTNIELLRQKQQLLGDQISNTKTKLSALKQAQAQLDEEIKKGGNVNQEEYRKLEREISMTESSLERLTNEAKNCHPYLAKVADALGKVGETASKVAKAGLDLTVAGIKAMATASIGAVTALGNLAIKAGQFADDLNTLASTTGLTTKQLQEFQYASDLIDVSVDTLAGALKKTTASMASAQKGTGATADAFKKLGVQVTNADGSLRNNNDVFNEAIKALGKVGNETERDALAMQIFGKSATELNPLIEGGIDALEQMSKQANDLGLILSQEALDGANAFNDQLDILKANGKSTFQVIGTEVATQLVPTIEAVNDYTMEMIKGITTSLKEGGVEGLLTELSKQFGNLLSDITKQLPKIAELGTKMAKTLVSAIKDNASEIGEAGSSVITTLITGFYEVLPDLIETAITLATSFVSSFGEKLPDLIPAIAQGIIGVADAIVNNLDLIINSALTLFLGLAEGLSKAIPQIVEKIPEIVKQIGLVLIDNLPTIIQAVSTIIIAIINTIGESANVLIPALTEVIIQLALALIDNLPIILDALLQVSTAMGGALVDNAGLIVEAGFKLIVALAQGLIKALPKLIEALPQIILAIANGLLELGKKLLEVGWNLIQTLAEGIVNAVTSLWEVIVFVWNYIKDAFIKEFANATQIGSNLIEGLWNGIKNAKDWLIGKIKSFCNDALGAIKAFFGIESPSRVMADEVGKYMAQGIGVGFTKTLPSVVSAMQDKLSGVTDAIQADLTFGDIPQIQGNQIISENSYVTRNYTNTIETVRQPQTVELVLDGTKLARAMIQPLDNEYNRLGVKI